MGRTVNRSAKGQSERIIASGERLTIETVADFSNLLCQAIDEAQTVVIEFSEAVTIDITALQVLYAASRMAKAQGKQLLHRGPTPSAMHEMAQAIGWEGLVFGNDGHISFFRQQPGEGQ